jgi:hypothetical protein
MAIEAVSPGESVSGVIVTSIGDSLIKNSLFVVLFADWFISL